MNSARWERIDKALDELLELSPAERHSRLAQLGESDADLRPDLERLLEADTRAGSGILDHGLAPLAGHVLDDTEHSDTPVGTEIGPYRVLGELGRGGMGKVLLAERSDGEFEHRVALKIVRGDHLHPELDLRLRHERQILARLNHPNIAALHDGGVTETGAPYFAMELVEGVPITEFCDRERLSVEERLHLFDSVCAAVQFAHRNLVIHRDITPGNVLVTGEGRVKLLDFGVAKLTDELDATQTGQHFLTLAFAAPEQLRDQPATVASDIYSLGVLLYELLSGCRPFSPDRDAAAMIRAILENSPPRASSHLSEEAARLRRTSSTELKSRLVGDLDMILDKALRKDPEERYGSVEELRLDLQRHEASLPVSARPATRVYHMRKFVRRHRLAVALGSASIAAIVAFAAWIAVLYARAERNLDRAVAAEASSAREAETSRQVTEFLIGLFEVASPEQSHGRDVSARELLEAGVRRIADDLDTEPSVRASLQLTMARSYEWIGMNEEALRLAEASAASRRALFGERSAEFANAQAEVGWLQLGLGMLEEAEATSREAIETMEAVLEPGSPELGNAYLALGETLLHRGRFAEAEGATKRALDIFESAPDPNPESVAHASNDLAAAYSMDGRHDEAGEMFVRAIAAHVDAGDSTHPSLATYMDNLGGIRTRQGRVEEAEALMSRALDISRVVFGDDHVEVAERANSLGKLYHRLERLDEAERLFRQSIEIWRANTDEDHPKIAWTLDNFAACLIDAGKLGAADSLSEEAVRMSEASVGPASVYHGAVLNTRADLRAKQGRWEDCVRLRAAALVTYETELGPDHAHVAQRLRDLALGHVELGRSDEAETHLRRALEIYETASGAESDEATAVRAELEGLRETGGGVARR